MKNVEAGKKLGIKPERGEKTVAAWQVGRLCEYYKN